MTTKEEVDEAVKYRIVVGDNGTRRYYNNLCQLHCEDGPAVVYADNTKVWYQNGVLHREDGPAIERSNGATAWYRNGVLHREDGPAVMRAGGSKEWWQNDLRHREDGPAVKCSDGSEGWFLRGVAYSKCEFAALSHEKRACA